MELLRNVTKILDTPPPPTSPDLHTSSHQTVWRNKRTVPELFCCKFVLNDNTDIRCPGTDFSSFGNPVCKHLTRTREKRCYHHAAPPVFSETTTTSREKLSINILKWKVRTLSFCQQNKSRCCVLNDEGFPNLVLGFAFFLIRENCWRFFTSTTIKLSQRKPVVRRGGIRFV